jgi:CheY-like chemotaxis protein
MIKKPTDIFKKKILIVDDDPDVSMSLKHVLETNRFVADSYNDPLLALQNFKPTYYDLVLLDIKMPEIDGLDLYQKMKNIDEKIKVCFLTASEMYYERFRRKPFGQLDKYLFVPKPIDDESLIEKINNIIDN